MRPADRPARDLRRAALGLVAKASIWHLVCVQWAVVLARYAVDDVLEAAELEPGFHPARRLRSRAVLAGLVPRRSSASALFAGRRPHLTRL